MAARVSPASLVLPALALTLLGCPAQPQGRATTPSPEPPGPGGEVTTEVAGGPQVEVTGERMCTRIYELKDGGCDYVSGYDLPRDECIANFDRSLADRGAEARLATQLAGRCLLDYRSCGAVSACVERMSAQPMELRACDDESMLGAAVGLPVADWQRRKGASTRFFREARSSVEEPIEVCRIPSEMAWLLDMSCDDGSNPYGGSYERAHASRVGNVGEGGKCGAIVDLYEVPCPEATYAVYMDAYVCPLPAP